MIVYIIHPYRGAGEPGERERNKAAIAEIARWIIAQGHCPVSPVHALSDFLDDTDPEQRAQALDLCKQLLKTSDEAWAFGNLLHSTGCVEELVEAMAQGPIIRWFHDWPDLPSLVLPKHVGDMLKERAQALEQAAHDRQCHAEAVATIAGLQARLRRYEGTPVPDDTQG